MKPIPLIDSAFTGHFSSFVLQDRQTRERVKQLGKWLVQAGVMLPLQTSGQHLLSVSQSLQTLLNGDLGSASHAYSNTNVDSNSRQKGD